MKYIKKVFFTIFFSIVGMISGAYVSSLTIQHNIGLAGGATVFWGGIIGAFFGLILGIFLNIKINNAMVRNVLSILGAVFLIGTILFIKVALHFD